jgi:hypothetical protein
METTHEPLHLGKLILVQWNIMNISTSSIWIYFDLMKHSNLEMVRNFGIVGKNAESLCVKFCDFVQYDALCKLFNLLLLNLWPPLWSSG